MKTFIFLGLVALASAAVRPLDEEELLQVLAYRDEAMEVEEMVARQNLEAIGHHYVEPAPSYEGRHIGLGLGVQLGPIGAGASTGLGWHGIGANAAAGFGHNYLNYGNRQHYSQYWAPQPQKIYQPALGRTIGLGAGVNVGPIGAGASAGIGHGQIGFSGGLGWGKYSNYGSPAHYNQYHSLPYYGPWFHPAQLV